MPSARRLVFCIFFFFISLLIFVPVTFAQESTPSAQTPTTFSPQSPQYANVVVINLIHSLSCLAEGYSVIGQPCVTYVGSVPKTVEYLGDRGAMGSIATVLTMLYETPPARTTEYLAEMGQGLGIVKEAHAQVDGTGNKVLSPILELWKISRNVSYAAMILIFIIIGFMIMFRAKINPQTVISAQAALPGLVIGLILITFSYFAAALIVDLTFVGTHLAANVYEKTVIQDGSMAKLLKDGNVISLFANMIDPTNTQGNNQNGASVVIDTAAATIKPLQQDSTFGSIITGVSMLGGCLVGLQMAPDVKLSIPIIGGLEVDAGQLAAKAISCTGGAGLAGLISKTEFAGGLIGLILYVVLIIALLMALFKLLFSLIISYITIIVTTIFGPFYFLVASIPGKQEVASTWFKTLLANVLVFPAVFAALVFAAYILGLKSDLISVNGSGVNFAGGTVPLLAGLPSDFLRIILAYGVLLISPTIPDAVREAFGVKTSPLGGAGLAAVGAGAGVVSSFAGKAFQQAGAERQAYQTALGRFRTGEIDTYPVAPRSPINKLLAGTWWQKNFTPERFRNTQMQREDAARDRAAGRRPAPREEEPIA